jgi:hypothetical protein
VPILALAVAGGLLALALSGILREALQPPAPEVPPLRADLRGALLPHARLAQEAGHTLRAELVIDPSGRVLVGVQGNLYDAASRAAVFSASLPELSSCARIPQGPLLATRGQRLGYPQAGAFRLARELPRADLRIVSWGPDRALLFGGGAEEGLILSCDRRGRLREVLRVEAEVTALTPAGEDLYFASQGQVYLLREDRRVEVAFALTGAREEPIRALCFDSEALVLYVLRGERLLALADARVRDLGSGHADAIAVHAGRLYLLHLGRGRLTAIASPPWTRGKGS